MPYLSAKENIGKSTRNKRICFIKERLEIKLAYYKPLFQRTQIKVGNGLYIASYLFVDWHDMVTLYTNCIHLFSIRIHFIANERLIITF